MITYPCVSSDRFTKLRQLSRERGERRVASRQTKRNVYHYLSEMIRYYDKKLTVRSYLQDTLLNKKDRAKFEELSALCLYQLCSPFILYRIKGEQS